MITLRKPTAIIILVLTLFLLPALACHLPLPEDASQETRQTATAEQKPTAEAIEAYENQIQAENNAVMENPDAKLVFSYAGENQSYHTGLRNRTVFFIDHDLNKVVASESAPFEEPFGCATAKGNDSVSFDGIIADGVEIVGDLTITTESTAPGCDGGPSTSISYQMTGTLAVQLVDGQWQGTVTGQSSLEQTWTEGGPAPETTHHGIEWTITGTPVE
jgi:hypothetical protein